MTTATEVEIPPHVDPSRVFMFDLYEDARLRDDVHEGLKSLHEEAPDIFYTPYNGGHWMVTRHGLVSDILRDFEHFSNTEMDIPKMGNQYVMIPLNLDPPDHTPYRAILMGYFGPKVVQQMEQQLRGWARRYIDQVAAEGHCDIAAVGAAFPVHVFLEMMGLPLERFDEFREVVVEYFGRSPVARRNEIRGWIFDLMRGVIAERRAAPRDDLITRLTTETINGRPITDTEIESICFLLFIAGLDTVANAIAFSMQHLATDAKLQKFLGEHPQRTRDFVEESLRRFSIVNGSRTVKRDFELGGVLFKTGDMVCCSHPLSGMDDQVNKDPMTFDLDRKDRQHTAFSVGPHLCVGHFLARAEMRIFVEEWLKRVPSFGVAAGAHAKPRAGKVMSIKDVQIAWPVKVEA